MNIRFLAQHALTEVMNLNQHLTDAERHYLDLELFDPKAVAYCIYGLATGNCFSKRTYELITLCAAPIHTYADSTKDLEDDEKNWFQEGPWSLIYGEMRGEQYFTVMERLVNDRYDAGLWIIYFLKGRISDLTIDDLVSGTTEQLKQRTIK